MNGAASYHIQTKERGGSLMRKSQKKKQRKLKKNTRRKVNHVKKNSEETLSNRLNSALLLINLLEVLQKLYELFKFIVDLF